MKYWITTHWPRKLSQNENATFDGVWVVDGKQRVIKRIEPGDLVWIYETKSGLAVIETLADGSNRKLKRKQGQMGLIGFIRIADIASTNQRSHPELYEDGLERWWRWFAPGEIVSASGFIPRTDFNKLIGFEENYVLHGFGEHKSGLKEIDKDTHERILKRYNQRLLHREKQRVKKFKRKSRKGGTGEGPIHKKLKEMIQNDPAYVLKEDGLRFIAVEDELPTYDRIDIVLMDKIGRYVVVEIKPDCPAGDIVGLMQCLKYRCLYSFIKGRDTGEVRAILAARTIARDIRSLCEENAVETRTINTD